jgi:hypothetical protein
MYVNACLWWRIEDVNTSWWSHACKVVLLPWPGLERIMVHIVHAGTWWVAYPRELAHRLYDKRLDVIGLPIYVYNSCWVQQWVCRMSHSTSFFIWLQSEPNLETPLCPQCERSQINRLMKPVTSLAEYPLFHILLWKQSTRIIGCWLFFPGLLSPGRGITEDGLFFSVLLCPSTSDTTQTNVPNL